jgi:hypothetical protein
MEKLLKAAATCQPYALKMSRACMTTGYHNISGQNNEQGRRGKIEDKKR